METGAASQDTDASGGLSMETIGIIVGAVVGSLGLGLACARWLCGDRMFPRLWKFIRTRRKRSSQGHRGERTAESRLENEEAIQLSIPSAGPAADGESRTSQSSTSIPSSEHDSEAESRVENIWSSWSWAIPWKMFTVVKK